MPLAPGTKLGRYEILSALGTGGMGGRNTAIGFSTVCFTAASAILLLPNRTRFRWRLSRLLPLTDGPTALMSLAVRFLHNSR